ncbi:MAG: Stk1 family PASTA domain-containing Ser/Thr kinase, partial [Tissierellia bacterium]|nr:Stk1 family PASTA domain-containing Ser/Thr kinase [Tissierellia bacterium]
MEIGTIFLERYKIVEKIGEGGMAIVYKAKCNLLDRFVAIKFLKDEYVKDDEFIEKFTRESKAAAKLNHPNIVGIYDFHETELDGKPQYVIVMEYVEGCTLKELIHEKGPLEEKQAVFIAEQILSALQEAHNHGIIHRDIKPHNIMITKNHVVKVTDFGIARATSSHTMTTTMEAIGSVHYFSPEQARGSFTDQRTDIYSFGIVFYEMLTGKRPFTGENPVTVAMKHIQEDIVPPGEILEGMSDLVEQIILKCTKKKQGERYQSIDEIMEELSKYHGQSKSFVPADEIESVLDQTRVMSKAEVEEAIERSEKKASKEIVPQPAPEKKMKETKKIHLVPIVLGILAAFILTTGLYIGFTKIQEKRQANRIHVIELPSVLGKTEAEAREILESLNLIMEVSKYV